MRSKLKVLICFVLVSLTMNAQQQIIDGVKRSISDLSVSVNTYKAALTRLKPAMTHESTKDKAETWWLAGKIAFGIYDKLQHNKAVGNKVDEKEMANYLTQGYNYCQKALNLDTVPELNSNGSPKLDSKTHKPKVKTKYSNDVTAKILEHLVDFGSVGGDLYNTENWKEAYDAWEAYHEIVLSSYAKAKRRVLADTVIGKMRFYQGLASFQNKDYHQAHQCFADARIYNYKQKAVFDNDLNVLVKLSDTTEVVNVAREAYKIHGGADIQYLRILINDYLNNQDYAAAIEMLDEAIEKDADNAEYYNLKGNIVEQQSGYEKALPLYQKAISVDAYYAEGQYDVGRCFYLKALDYSRKNPRATTWMVNNELNPIYREAMSYLETAYDLDPNNADLVHILKDIYYKLGYGDKLQELER